MKSKIALLAALLTIVNAHPGSEHELYASKHKRDPRNNHFVERQDPQPYPTGPAYDVPPLASIVPTPVAYTEDILPVPTNYAPGDIPPNLANAPPLPACE